MQLELVWKIKPYFDQIFFTPTGWFLFPLGWEGKGKGVLNIVEETTLENSNEGEKKKKLLRVTWIIKLMSNMSVSSVCLIRTTSISRSEHFLCVLQYRDKGWHISSPLPLLTKWWVSVQQHSLHSSKRFCLNYLRLVCCGFADSGWDPSSWFGMLQWWLLRSQNFPKAFPDKQKTRDPEHLIISLKGLCILGSSIRLWFLG